MQRKTVNFLWLFRRCRDTYPTCSMGAGLLPRPAQLGDPLRMLFPKPLQQSKESVNAKAVPPFVQQGEASSSLTAVFLSGLCWFSVP